MKNLLQKTALFSLLVCIHMLAEAQEKVLAPEEIKQLVVNKIKGYEDDGEARSKLIQIGNIQYSLSEHNFANGTQKIRVLLFDYKDAPIMYNQATKIWQHYTPVISDTTMLRPLAMTNCSGWESYRKRNNSSQIYLGICDRFFLSITGEGVDLEALKTVLSQFKFEQFPK